MLRKILLFRRHFGLAARAFRAYTAQRTQRGAAPGAKEAVKVWEDEGGALKPQPRTY